MPNSKRSMLKMTVGSDQWNRCLKQGASFFGIDLGEPGLQSFTRYAKELLVWNNKINLTSITEPEDIIEKHFIDSLSVYPYLPPDACLLDLGTGAGFPSIPLKIILPNLSAMLVDASVKKISFIKQVIRILNLAKIQAKHVRVEDLHQKNTHSNNFEVVICRAFSALDKFLDLALPLLTKGGIALAMKGMIPISEIEALGGKGANPQTIFRRHYHLKLDSFTYQLPFSHSHRSLIRFTLLNHSNLEGT